MSNFKKEEEGVMFKEAGGTTSSQTQPQSRIPSIYEAEEDIVKNAKKIVKSLHPTQEQILQMKVLLHTWIQIDTNTLLVEIQSRQLFAPREF